jgi:DNA polymerase
MSDRRALESLLAFWVDAGVDAAVHDQAPDRTAAPPPRQAEPASVVTVRPPPAPASPRPSIAPPPSARPAALRAAAEADDLVALEAAIAAFDGCPLKAGARRAVFARGDPAAPIMAIGEGPGAEEDIQGLPFVGRAGKLLDRMLTAAGLADQVFITNTVFWRPPGNRTPTPEEQAVCEPFLHRAIEIVRPRMLLLLGAAAAKSMLGRSEGILALRGRWVEWRSPDGTLEIPALPTLHPSFLLRQPLAKKKSWADFLILSERLNRPARPN